MANYYRFDESTTPFAFDPSKDEVICSTYRKGIGEFLIVWHEEPWLLEELFLIVKEEGTGKYTYGNEGLAAICGNFPSLTEKLTEFCRAKRNDSS